MIRNALKIIAQCFESEHIVYGLGGSCVLVAYDILENMHDIDIVVALEDIEKAKKIMDIIAVLKESGNNCFVSTEHNYLYDMNGIEVELMCNMHIKHSQGLYAVPFNKNRRTYRMSIDDIMIPVMSLEDWYIFYQLIERQDRVDQIEAYFLENGITHGSYLINAIKANIPRQLKVDIVKIMSKVMMV